MVSKGLPTDNLCEIPITILPKYQQGLLELEEFFSGVRTRVNAIGKGATSDSAKAEIREDLLNQEFSFPEVVAVKPKNQVSEGTVMKPTGKTITEKAGVWGPRKQELFERQTRRSQDITRSIIVQEELAKIFRVKPVGNPGSFQPKEIATALRTQELIREHLPELEAVWQRQSIDTTDRLFYRHPDSNYLEEQVLGLLRQYGQNPVWGRPTNRQARVMSMRGGKSSGSEIPMYKGEGISSAGQYDKLRGNIAASIVVSSPIANTEHSRGSGSKTAGNAASKVSTPVKGQISILMIALLGLIKQKVG